MRIITKKKRKTRSSNTLGRGGQTFKNASSKCLKNAHPLSGQSGPDLKLS